MARFSTLKFFFPSLWSIVIIFVIIVVSFEMNVFVFMMDCVRLTGRADRERRFVGVITNRCFQMISDKYLVGMGCLSCNRNCTFSSHFRIRMIRYTIFVTTCAVYLIASLRNLRQKTFFSSSFFQVQKIFGLKLQCLYGTSENAFIDSHWFIFLVGFS